jgi:hypothetical protein
MPLTLYDITISLFIKELNILSKLLQRGADYAKDPSNAVTEEALVDARLVADMKGLVFQGLFSPSSLFRFLGCFVEVLLLWSEEVKGQVEGGGGWHDVHNTC